MRLEGIPMCPSMNHAYTGIFRRHKSREVIQWERQYQQWEMMNRKLIHLIHQEFSKPNPGYVIHIHCDYYFHWSKIYCKNGKPKKLDSSNRLKLIHDKIAQSIDIDDQYFFDGSFKKRHTKGSDQYVDVEFKWVETGDHGNSMDKDQTA